MRCGKQFAQIFNKHYAIAMGEDFTDDFDEQAIDEPDTAWEDEYAQDGGFGQDIGYHYESDVDDVDEQAEKTRDDSSSFTKFGDDNAYSVTGNDNDEAPTQNDDDDDEQMMPSRASYRPDDDDAEDDDESDDFDGEYDAESEEDEEGDEDEDDDDEEETAPANAAMQMAGAAASMQQDYDGAIKWQPGDEITLELLNQIWKECREIDQVRPMMDSANSAVMQAISSLGPNLMLRLNKYVSQMNGGDTDTIGSLLELASKNGKRLTFTALSVVEAIFDQQWTQTTIIAGLPKMLQAAIKTEPLHGILNKIFTVAVPLINQKLKK